MQPDLVFVAWKPRIDPCNAVYPHWTLLVTRSPSVERIRDFFLTALSDECAVHCMVLPFIGAKDTNGRLCRQQSGVRRRAIVEHLSLSRMQSLKHCRHIAHCRTIITALVRPCVRPSVCPACSLTTVDRQVQSLLRFHTDFALELVYRPIIWRINFNSMHIGLL